MFFEISNVLALSYYRGWHQPRDARKPNSILGVLVRKNFSRFVTLPGEGQVPQLGLSWEHYLAAPASLEEMIDGVLCHTRAEMVIRNFSWRSSLEQPAAEPRAISFVIGACTQYR